MLRIGAPGSVRPRGRSIFSTVLVVLPEPVRCHGQAARRPAAGHDRPRVLDRQCRHRLQLRGGGQGLPLHHRHARGHERGAQEDHARLRRPMVYTPGGESDVDLALAEARGDPRRAIPARYWVPAQFANPENVDAHTAPPAPSSGSRPAAAWAPSWPPRARGGTISGVGAPLRERDGRGQVLRHRAGRVRAARAARVGPARHRGHRRRLRAREPGPRAPDRRDHREHGRDPGHGPAPGARGRALLRHLLGVQRGRGAQAATRAGPSCPRSSP